jgi:hypothetical protein
MVLLHQLKMMHKYEVLLLHLLPIYILLVHHLLPLLQLHKQLI